ncbi:Oidioi.mRNA.OKI2018_I69.XSR.g15346.t1.cds [Oikopleura dioica]|uniref:Oidioi.mRNA.OKI2018_I69.XSR.g15346.t1.cds n=1 Tax=Oikopleura dioica TaxID=34765 RepID=A0ABN7SCK7_OIKDI|nr:Oidioi.mRNA.OKI2018_I69.XSR.g15346.t1.cds [Oikopleura dioica]
MEVDETCTEEPPLQEMSIEDQFRNRMRKLYPAVDESVTPLPRFWTSHKELSSKLIIQQGTRVEYKGPGSKGYKDAASARTNTEIPAVCGLYYFEITVISKGRDGYIGIGLVAYGDESQQLNAQQGGYNRLPGWDQDSFGYHGDDGNAFSKSAHGQKYGPIYGSGDVVGCCINMVNRTIFFTKNGSNLGIVFEDVPDKPMYPTVGLQTPGELIEANFGQKPFLFDFESYLADFRRDQIVQIKNFSIDDTDGSFQLKIQAIIANYLNYQGYSKAATAFEEATRTKCAVEAEATKKTRIGIVSCILKGELTEAIARLSADFPNLLENNHELVFQLKFQQLVEIIGGTESEMKNYKETEHSFGMLPASALQDFIDKGRHLREFVLESNSDNESMLKKINQIKKISTLLIDNDPSKSPAADLFEKSRRQKVATAVSAAIRQSQKLSARPKVAVLVNHVRLLHDTLLQRDIPQAAFTLPENFLNE